MLRALRALAAGITAVALILHALRRVACPPVSGQVAFSIFSKARRCGRGQRAWLGPALAAIRSHSGYILNFILVRVRVSNLEMWKRNRTRTR
eukprot:scaffold404259_cov34-Prasinocladus_malaysianus.AAC.1